jgi:hypothetical protein
MIQEVGYDVRTKRIVWVKVKSDYEILFRLMDELDPAANDATGSGNRGQEGTLVTYRKIRDR